MIYPKPVMSKRELQEMGFPEQYLLDSYHHKGQEFAWKQNYKRKSSAILFDTELFEKHRMKQLKAQKGELYPC